MTARHERFASALVAVGLVTALSGCTGCGPDLGPVMGQWTAWLGESTSKVEALKKQYGEVTAKLGGLQSVADPTGAFAKARTAVEESLKTTGTQLTGLDTILAKANEAAQSAFSRGDLSGLQTAIDAAKAAGGPLLGKVGELLAAQGKAVEGLRILARQQATAPPAPSGEGPAPDLGPLVKRILPSNVELSVPERGIEIRLIAFLADPNRPVDTTTWFDFDRLRFESGSTVLTAESAEQLRNFAEILKAFPTTKLKIGGFTDDAGQSDDNQKLSQVRAENVVKELLKLGVAADRLAAEGYGERYPIAENATPEGRAQNRRISSRVTAK